LYDRGGSDYEYDRMTVEEAKQLKVGDVLYDSLTEMNWTVIMADLFKNHPKDCEVIIENEDGIDAHICPAYVHRFRKI
jgi:hypothetical protein